MENKQQKYVNTSSPTPFPIPMVLGRVCVVAPWTLCLSCALNLPWVIIQGMHRAQWGWLQVQPLH